jgi:hypothetical protein
MGIFGVGLDRRKVVFSAIDANRGGSDRAVEGTPASGRLDLPGHQIIGSDVLKGISTVNLAKNPCGNGGGASSALSVVWAGFAALMLTLAAGAALVAWVGLLQLELPTLAGWTDPFSLPILADAGGWVGQTSLGQPVGGAAQDVRLSLKSLSGSTWEDSLLIIASGIFILLAGTGLVMAWIKRSRD